MPSRAWARGLGSHSLAQTVGVLLLHTLIGLLLPCIIAWQSEYKARYNFLLEVSGPGGAGLAGSSRRAAPGPRRG